MTSGLYLVDLADILRARGLAVTEQDGWKTRARGSGGYTGGRPWCVMWHHAASAPNASTESVAYYGSYGSENAPVCNLVLGRAGDVIVCAAGATNTNGKGGPVSTSSGQIAADQMNTAAIGVEAVNTGVGEAWPAAQIDAYFAINNACAEAYGFLPTDCFTHAVWAPGRKIDPATAAAVEGPWRPRALNSSGTWNLDDIRAEAVARTAPTPTPPPIGDLMFTILDVTGDKFGGLMDGNGIAGPIVWLTPERYETCLRLGAPEVVRSRGDLAGCDLIGAMPFGYDENDFANVILVV